MGSHIFSPVCEGWNKSCAICGLPEGVCTTTYNPKYYFDCTHCNGNKPIEELIPQRGICRTCSDALDGEANGN